MWLLIHVRQKRLITVSHPCIVLEVVLTTAHGNCCSSCLKALCVLSCALPASLTEGGPLACLVGLPSPLTLM